LRCHNSWVGEGLTIEHRRHFESESCRHDYILPSFACSEDPPVPGQDGAGSASAEGGETVASGDAEGPLPDGWVEAFDAASGRPYYVHLASSTTTWERPAPEAGASSDGSSGGNKRAALSPEVAAAWAQLADYLRLEATQKISAKNKKFAGLRKFAEIAARRKREAAKKKAEEDALEEAALAAAQAAASKPKRSLLSLLETDAPKVEKKDIEEFAEQSFELNRKGFFGAKTTVDKVSFAKGRLPSSVLY
jgi:WW domain